MSLRVEQQNQHQLDDQKQVDTKKFPSDSSRFAFESQLRWGGPAQDWKNWDGYKPEYDQFDKNVKIEETEDTIKAEIDDENIEPEKKGLLDEFVSWFKEGVEKVAKQIGKAFEVAFASMVAMSIEQAMTLAFQSVKLDSSQDPRKIQLPPESHKALADAAAKGPKHLAEAVKTLVAQNPAMALAPAIAAAAMKEAVDRWLAELRAKHYVEYR